MRTAPARRFHFSPYDDLSLQRPMVVRYSDLDAQGHLNHARYFSVMEEARFKYLMAVGLWTDTRGFNAVGQIVAEAACSYKRPVFIGQTVDVAVRVARLGNKSMELEYPANGGRGRGGRRAHGTGGL